MTPRELVVRTLNQQPVARVPREVWIDPAIEAQRGDEIAELRRRLPSDIVVCEPVAKRGDKGDPPPTDAWGCALGAADAKSAPLREVGKIAGFKPPTELLAADRFQRACESCEGSTRFVLARSDVRPLERLMLLRGAKAALVDLARGSKAGRGLLQTVHDFHCRELGQWAKTEVDGVLLRDDFGTAESLHVAPALWREIFRPLYRDYCRILHEHDKFVLLSAAGNITDVFGDLVKLGIDAIHAPWACMSIDRLAKRHCGQVAFRGALADEGLLAAGKPDEIRQSVQKLRQAVDGCGAIARLAWTPQVGLRAVVVCLEQWLMPAPAAKAGP